MMKDFDDKVSVIDLKPEKRQDHGESFFEGIFK